MLEQLRKNVCEANKMLVKYRLVMFSNGNVSGLDRKTGYIAIKPSGIDYSILTPQDIVIVDSNGNIIEGDLNPSVDLPTHIEMYKAFPEIGGVVHTHSKWATIWAQAGENIPPFGTTHADDFYGEIPCTRIMKQFEVEENYEYNTAKVIIEVLQKKMRNIVKTPAVLVRNHGPFVWGEDCFAAVKKSVILEQVAEMAWRVRDVQGECIEYMPRDLMDKHFFRKNGNNAYYGQK